MSSKAKGRRTLNKAKKYLEEQGYIIDEVELGGKFRKYRDLFAGYCTSCWQRTDDEGCCKNPDRFEGFDLVAVRAKLPVVLFVQVKTNQPSTQRNYKKFAAKFASRYVGVWVMTWYDHDGLRIQKYYSNETIKELDLRKSGKK